MIIDFRQLEEIKAQFTELGRTVSDLSSTSESTFKALSVSMEKLNATISSAVPVKGLDELFQFSKEIASKTIEFTNTINGVLGKFDNIAPVTDALMMSGSVFSKLAEELAKVGPSPRRKSFVKNAGTIKKGSGGMGVPKDVKRLMKSAAASVNRVAAKLKLPGPGNILKGTVLWMAFGFMDDQRLQALAAKAKNVIIPAFDSTVKGLVDTAGQKLADFAEKMQQYYKISKEEVFSIEKAFVDSGVGIKTSLMKSVDKGLGLVGENLVSYSLALDKMFGLSTGTSAKGMISFAREFGMSMEQASDSMTKAYFLGREAGIGGEYFVSNMQKSASALSNLGISVDGVNDFLFILQKRLRDIGVPKHLAAKEAAEGLSQIAGGLQNLSTDWKVLLGEFLYKSEGLAAKHEFESGITRLVEDPQDFQQFISTIVGFVRERTASEAQLEEVLQHPGGGLGWGVKGARTALQFDAAFRSGDTVDLEKMKKEMETFRKDLKGSLDRKASEETQFRRSFNKWMRGMAKIGKGLLGLVISFLSRLYMAIQSIPIVVSNLFKGEKGMAQNRAMAAAMDAISCMGTNIAKGFIDEGVGELRESGQEMLSSLFGDMLGVLSDSLTWDPSKVVADLEGSNLKGPKQMPGPTSDLKVIAIPVHSTGEHEVYMPEDPINKKSLLGHVFNTNGETAWKGHGARIINYGVDDSGNIMVGIVGDCPRCGLVLGTPQREVSGSAFTSGMPGMSDSISFPEGGMIRSSTTSKRALKPSEVSSLSGLTGDQNLEALTRMLYTEGFISKSGKNKGRGKVYSEQGREELAGIGYTALNRLKQGGYGSNLYDVITGGKDFGKQGGKRPYGTAREINTPAEQKEYARVQEFAKNLISGKVENPVGGATHFAHNLKGGAYAGSKKYMPGFAFEKELVAATAEPGQKAGGSALFFEKKGKGASSIAERGEIFDRYKQAYDKKHKSSVSEVYDPDLE